MYQCLTPFSCPSVLRKAFAMFDENKTGFIQTDKLMGILGDLGQSVDPDELRNAIKEIDIDGKMSSRKTIINTIVFMIN